MGLSAISLVSGAGRLDLAARWAGLRTVCYVENDPYAQGILMSRIRDGQFDAAPIWDDVRTFDGTQWRGKVDCVFGGFPCQDVSIAGKRKGIKEGTRSWLWKEFARIICEVGPRFVLVENVSGLLLGGHLGTVLGDLAEMGFNAQWAMFPASAIGAPHQRLRIFIVANSKEIPINIMGIAQGKELHESFFYKGWRESFKLRGCDLLRGNAAKLVPPVVVYKSSIHRMDDGMEYQSYRIGCCGNGVVPQQAIPAFEKLKIMIGAK